MKQKSLLLVDDEQIILNSLSRELRLQNSEFKVSLASSGEEAVAKIDQDLFDLVVTDLLMPGIDGFQVLKAAKKNGSRTMVIILTGCNALESVIDALRLGADDFLLKPCDPDELLFRLGNCLTKQELQKTISLYEKVLPVCSYCKRIRDDRQMENGDSAWYSLEEYFVKAKGVSVSHGCCPQCFEAQTRELDALKSQLGK